MTTNVKSAISTAVFTCLVLLLMVFVSGYTYDEEENRKENPEDYNEKIPPAGFEVSFGENPEVGKGDDPARSSTESKKTTKTTPPAPKVKTPTTDKGTGKIPAGEETIKSDGQTETTQPKEEPQLNPEANYPGRRNPKNTDGRNNNGGNTNNPGFGGDPDGDPNSTSHTSGTGDAVYSFTGPARSARALPKPDYKSNQQGKIVVKIKVDRQGKVVFVDAPAKGSTITTKSMVDQAKAAAKRARFNANDNAPEEQVGTITYIFKIN